jgi:hypothetical protein
MDTLDRFPRLVIDDYGAPDDAVVGARKVDAGNVSYLAEGVVPRCQFSEPLLPMQDINYCMGRSENWFHRVPSDYRAGNKFFNIHGFTYY